MGTCARGHFERAWNSGWPLLARRAGLQYVQFLARLEAHRLAGIDADLGAGAGIAADAGFAGADAENAESAQFDALAGGKSLLEALENRIHRGLCLGARQARALDYMMDDVLLNQWGTLVGLTEMTVLRPAGLMLQILLELRNIGIASASFPLRKARCCASGCPSVTCSNPIVSLSIAGTLRR